MGDWMFVGCIVFFVFQFDGFVLVDLGFDILCQLSNYRYSGRLIVMLNGNVMFSDSVRQMFVLVLGSVIFIVVGIVIQDVEVESIIKRNWLFCFSLMVVLFV